MRASILWPLLASFILGVAAGACFCHLLGYSVSRLAAKYTEARFCEFIADFAFVVDLRFQSMDKRVFRLEPERSATSELERSRICRESSGQQ